MSPGQRWARRFLVLAVIGGAGALLYEQLARQQPGIVTLREAWALVQLEPREPERWAALGDAQARVDDVMSAEASYRNALRLGGDDPEVAGRLGFLLYRAGNLASARHYLDIATSAGVEMPMLEFTLKAITDELAAGGQDDGQSFESPPPQGELMCTMKAIDLKGGAALGVPVRFGPATAAMVLDTGASMTSITPKLLERSGIRADEGETIRAFTAAGATEFATAMMPWVEVGGHRVENLRVAICPACGLGGSDGLLGLDVQAALGLEVDARQREFRFADCR